MWAIISMRAGAASQQARRQVTGAVRPLVSRASRLIDAHALSMSALAVLALVTPVIPVAVIRAYAHDHGGLGGPAWLIANFLLLGGAAANGLLPALLRRRGILLANDIWPPRLLLFLTVFILSFLGVLWLFAVTRTPAGYYLFGHYVGARIPYQEFYVAWILLLYSALSFCTDTVEMFVPQDYKWPAYVLIAAGLSVLIIPVAFIYTWIE